MTNKTHLITLMLGLWFMFAICGPRVIAQENSPTMTSDRPVAFAVSPPLRELAKLPPRPHYGFPDQESTRLFLHSGRDPGPAVDPVEQAFAAEPSNISIGLSILGIARNCGFFEPDTNAAVGDTQIVEWVNFEYAVYNKSTGAQELGPIPGNQIWQSLGGPCYQNNDGDPIAQWDKVYQRWLLAQNVFNSPGILPPYYGCVAVSTSSDATGSYYLYQFPFGDNFPDYPKWGIWPNAYFQVLNNLGNEACCRLGAEVCAYNSAKLLVGDSTAEQICFQLTPDDLFLLPGDVDSPTPPPANQDEFFIGAYDVDQSNNHLYLYSMHPDFANPSQSTFTGSGLADPITVPVYSSFCPNQDCIPQEGTGVKLNSLGNRLMYRFAYWNDGPLANVGSHATRVPAQHWYVNHVTTASGGQAGVRWYEFRAPVRTVMISGVSLFQSGTYAPDSNYRWAASMAQDKMGDIALGYSVASANMWDSIAATGRVPTDPLGQMEAEISLVTGTGSQEFNDGLGDYSSMAIDADGCTFWYAQEYYVTPSSYDWQTKLTSFRFNGCH